MRTVYLVGPGNSDDKSVFQRIKKICNAFGGGYCSRVSFGNSKASIAPCYMFTDQDKAREAEKQLTEEGLA